MITTFRIANPSPAALHAFKLCNEDAPELRWSLVSRDRLVVPPQVLAAVTAEGHAPAVARKPCMGLDGFPNGYGTGAGVKGMEIELNARGIHKGVSIGPPYDNQPIRVGDQPVTADTLVCLRTISAYPVQGRVESQHRSSKMMGNVEYPLG